MREAVSVRELTRRFGDFTAVDGITFQVREGEIFGFLGPNGAGKTTTIKMLTGLLRPSGGSGRVAGYDIATESEEVRRRIGYMSQRFSLYGDLTVEENIELFAGLYGVSGRRLRERKGWILEMAGLEGREGRPAAELPLGWKQRLALGCALLHEPPILFLDEPTSGVDPVARRSFWDLINVLAAGGTTVLVTTHHMEEAEYCNRLALMNRGRLVAVDAPEGLRRRLREPLLEVRTPDPARAVELLRRAPGVVEAALFGRRVHVLAESAQKLGGRIPGLLAGGGIPCEGVEEVAPSLEDVFVALILEDSQPAEARSR